MWLATPQRPTRQSCSCARPRAGNISTLALSEAGSRSHFWAPVSRAVQANGGVHLTASKSFVTSAGKADGYVVSTLAANGMQPLESTLYLVLRDNHGLRVSGTWKGVGMRGNASAPMTLENVALGESRALSAPGKGLDMMLGVILPVFQIGSAAVAVGIAEAAVQATIRHLTHARFEESNSTLAELPTLRARVAEMRISDGSSQGAPRRGAGFDRGARTGHATAGPRGKGRGHRSGRPSDGDGHARVRRGGVRADRTGSSGCFAMRAHRSSSHHGSSV